MDSQCVEVGEQGRAHTSPSVGDGKSCCMSPFLWALRASSFWPWVVINSLTEETKSPIFFCSPGRRGKQIGQLRTSSLRRFVCFTPSSNAKKNGFLSRTLKRNFPLIPVGLILQMR